MTDETRFITVAARADKPVYSERCLKMLTATNDKVRVHPASPIVTVAVL